jgi:hypothetical protein
LRIPPGNENVTADSKLGASSIEILITSRCMRVMETPNAPSPFAVQCCPA